MKNHSDGELLSTYCLSGDEDAFTELVNRHSNTAHNAAFAVLGDWNAAEDVVQAALVMLMRKAPSLNDDGRSVAGWLHQVAVNLARSENRRRRSRAAHEKEMAMFPDRTSETSGIDAATLATVHEEIAELSDTHRDAVVLHYLEGLSYEQAAVTMRCKLATFRTRLMRAREKLRRRLLKRGVEWDSAGLGAILAQGASAAEAPAALVAWTCKVAGLMAAGKGVEGVVSAKVAALAESAAKMMFWAKVKTATIAVVASVALVAGGALAAREVLAPRTPAPVTVSAESGQVWSWDDKLVSIDGRTRIERTSPALVPGLAGVREVATSGGNVHYSVALKTDGSLLAWGDNRWGQLGDGTTMDRPRPVPVSGLVGVTALAAKGHVLALKNDSSVWAWGLNDRGQLGDGTKTHRLTPAPVKLSDGAPLAGVIAIAAGCWHSVALKADGSAWAWGYNEDGQLGDGTTADRLTPVPVRLADGHALAGIAAIAAGSKHTLALTRERTLWAWGYNKYGQLGDGEQKSDGSFGDKGGFGPRRKNPVRVTLADGRPLAGVTAVSAGGHQSVALTAAGTPWIWGRYYNEAQSGSHRWLVYPEPLKLADGAALTNVTAIAAGHQHALALTRERTVLTWGRHRPNQVPVVLADGTPLAKVTAMAADVDVSVAVTSDP